MQSFFKLPATRTEIVSYLPPHKPTSKLTNQPLKRDYLHQNEYHLEPITSRFRSTDTDQNGGIPLLTQLQTLSVDLRMARRTHFNRDLPRPKSAQTFTFPATIPFLIGAVHHGSIEHTPDLIILLNALLHPNSRERISPIPIINSFLSQIPRNPHLEKVLDLPGFWRSFQAPSPLPPPDSITFNDGTAYYKSDFQDGVQYTMDKVDKEMIYLRRLRPEPLMATKTSDMDAYIYAVQRDLYMNHSMQSSIPHALATLLAIFTPCASLESGTHSLVLDTIHNLSYDSGAIWYLSPALYCLKYISEQYGTYPLVDHNSLIYIPPLKADYITTLPDLISALVNVHLHWLSGAPYNELLAQLSYVLHVFSTDCPAKEILALKDLPGLLPEIADNTTSGFVATIDPQLQSFTASLPSLSTPRKPIDLSLPPLVHKEVTRLLRPHPPNLTARATTTLQRLIAENLFLKGDSSGAVQDSGNAKINHFQISIGKVIEEYQGIPVTYEPVPEFGKMHHWLRGFLDEAVHKVTEMLTHTSVVEHFKAKLTTRSQGVRVENSSQRYLSFLRDHTYLYSEEYLRDAVMQPNTATSRFQVKRRSRNIQMISNAAQYVYLLLYLILDAAHFPSMAMYSMTGLASDYATLATDSVSPDMRANMADVKGMDASWHGSLMTMIYTTIIHAIMSIQTSEYDIVPYQPFSGSIEYITDVETRRSRTAFMSPMAKVMCLATDALTHLITVVRGHYGIPIKFGISLGSGELPTSQLNSLASLMMLVQAYTPNLSSLAYNPPFSYTTRHRVVMGDDIYVAVYCRNEDEIPEIDKALQASANMVGFATEAMSAKRFNEFLMMQTVNGIKGQKPQQPTVLTSERPYHKSSKSAQLSAITSGAIELGDRSPYMGAVTSLIWLAPFFVGPEMTRRGRNTLWSCESEKRPGFWLVYPTFLTPYLHPNVRYRCLSFTRHKTVPISSPYIPPSPITSFTALNAYIKDDSQRWSLIDGDALLRDGYFEAQYLIQRPSKNRILQAKKREPEARMQWALSKDVLVDPRMRDSNAAFAELVSQSHEPANQQMPWSRIVPEGTTVAELEKQRLLYGLALDQEKQETFTDELQYYAISYDLRKPDWFDAAAITCSETMESFDETDDAKRVPPDGDAYRVYCSRSEDSLQYHILKRTGLLTQRGVMTGSTALERWSKAHDAQLILSALRLAAQYEARVPHLIPNLMRTFGVPVGIRSRVADVVRIGSILPGSLNLASLTKYTNWLNIRDLSAFRGVTTNAVLYPPILRSSAAAEANFYWSCFYAHSSKTLSVTWGIPAIFFFHGINPRIESTLPSLDKVVVLELKKPSNPKGNSFGPLPIRRLDDNSARHWTLSTTPETAQFSAPR